MSSQPSQDVPPLTSTGTLSSLVRTLLNRYARVLRNPSVRVFDEEKTRASEPLVLVQVLALACFIALTIALSQPAFSLVTPIFYSVACVFVIGGFFLTEYVSYLTARAFRGQGTFVQQCYLSLLISLPLTVIYFFVARIPFVGDRLVWLLDVYGFVLYVIMIRAVHNLDLWRALAATITPFVVSMALIGTLIFLGIVL